MKMNGRIFCRIFGGRRREGGVFVVFFLSTPLRNVILKRASFVRERECIYILYIYIYIYFSIFTLCQREMKVQPVRLDQWWMRKSHNVAGHRSGSTRKCAYVISTRLELTWIRCRNSSDVSTRQRSLTHNVTGRQEANSSRKHVGWTTYILISVIYMCLLFFFFFFWDILNQANVHLWKWNSPASIEKPWGVWKSPSRKSNS